MIRLLDHISTMLEDMVILDMALLEVSLAQRSVHTLSRPLFLLFCSNISLFPYFLLLRISRKYIIFLKTGFEVHKAYVFTIYLI